MSVTKITICFVLCTMNAPANVDSKVKIADPGKRFQIDIHLTVT